MKDTFFAPTPERMPRVATIYQRTRRAWSTTECQPVDERHVLLRCGGLMSTAEDYLQFAQMLVNGGQLNGKGCSARRRSR